MLDFLFGWLFSLFDLFDSSSENEYIKKELDERLVDVVDNLYEVFNKYTLKEKMAFCECCQLEADEIKLHNKPLNIMNSKDFGPYPGKAMTTFGDEDDYRHFLPRLLELEALGYYPDLQWILMKLDYAGWKKWDKKEVDAILNFFRVLLSTLPNEKEDGYEYENTEYEEMIEELEQFGLVQEVLGN